MIQATYLSLLQWSRWSKMPEPPPQKCSKPGCDFVTPDGCPTWDHTLTPVMPLQCPLSLLPANLSPSYRRPLLHSILLFHHLIPCLVISYLWSGILICNKTKGVSVQLVDLLKSPIFIVQKAAAPQNGVEFHQKSIGIIRCSVAMLYDDERRHTMPPKSSWWRVVVTSDPLS